MLRFSSRNSLCCPHLQRVEVKSMVWGLPGSRVTDGSGKGWGMQQEIKLEHEEKPAKLGL